MTSAEAMEPSVLDEQIWTGRWIVVLKNIDEILESCQPSPEAEDSNTKKYEREENKQEIDEAILQSYFERNPSIWGDDTDSELDLTDSDESLSISSDTDSGHDVIESYLFPDHELRPGPNSESGDLTDSDESLNTLPDTDSGLNSGESDLSSDQEQLLPLDEETLMRYDRFWRPWEDA